MQQRMPRSSNRVQMQVSPALMLKMTVLLLLMAIVARFHTLMQAEDQYWAEQIDQAQISRIEQLKSAQNYRACITEAQQISLNSNHHAQASTLADQCRNLDAAALRLRRAQTLAANGQPQAAIAEVKPILKQAGISDWVASWSRQIMQTAENYYHDPNSGLETAIQTASAISAENALYPEAQQQIRFWRSDWSDNGWHWQAAQLALTAGQTELARAEIQQIKHPYWQQQAQPLLEALYAKPSTAASHPVATVQPQTQFEAGSSSDYGYDYIDVKRNSDGLIVSVRFWLPVSLSTVFMALLHLRRR